MFDYRSLTSDNTLLNFLVLIMNTSPSLAITTLPEKLSVKPNLQLIPSERNLATERRKAKIHLKGTLAAEIITRFGLSSKSELADFLNLNHSYLPRVFITEGGVGSKWAIAAAISMPEIDSRLFGMMVADKERPSFVIGLEKTYAARN